MAQLPPITVRQPQPHDIVDNPVGIAGIGTGFEGTFSARIRDGNGAELVQQPIHAGGMGLWGNFLVELPVGVPATPQGTLEVFEFSAQDGSEINKVVVPIVFGSALMTPDDYHGFRQYPVVPGDTLAKIAKRPEHYDDASKWPRIFEANRHQIQDPNRIFPGQVLRIPG